MEKVNIEKLMLSDVIEQIKKTQPYNARTSFTIDDIYQTNGQILELLTNIVDTIGDMKASEAKNPNFQEYIKFIFTF